MKDITIKQLREAHKLLDKGYTYREIAKEFDIPLSTLHHNLKKYKGYKELERIFGMIEQTIEEDNAFREQDSLKVTLQIEGENAVESFNLGELYDLWCRLGIW
jgi:predicted DNA-binding protein YlxM (UPF0122 family)